jgi:predicted HTH domain antitoxin
MALEKQATPEEATLILSRMIVEGRIARPELLRELMRVGLSEQKLWKAIRSVQTGKISPQKGAEIAGLDIERFRKLLETHARP